MFLVLTVLGILLTSPSFAVYTSNAALDTTPPDPLTVSIVKLSTTTYKLIASSRDNTGGSRMEKIEIYVDDVKKTNTVCNPPSNTLCYYSGRVDSSSHTYRIVARDNAGNSRTETGTFAKTSSGSLLLSKSVPQVLYSISSG